MAQDRTSTKPGQPVPHRKRDRYAAGEAEAWAFLRSEWLGHLALATSAEPGAAPHALPMVYAAEERGSSGTIWLHGSTGAGAALLARSGGELAASFTVTRVDAIVLARSAMHHSVDYVCALAHGRLRLVAAEADKRHAFDRVLDAVSPGRSAECRPADAKELAETAVLALEVDVLTLKRRDVGVSDDEADLSLPYWAGTLPVTRVVGPPRPAGDVGPEVPLPAAYAAEPAGVSGS